MTVLVTGAASGIGAALVDRLLTRGEPVVALDRVDLDDSRPGLDTIRCDLADPRAVSSALDRLGDRVVNAVAHVAGVPGTAPPDTVLAVNVLAPALLLEPLFVRMPAGSAVVTVASVAAGRSAATEDELDELLACRDTAQIEKWLAGHPHTGPEAYDTSKAALVRWSRLTAGRCVPRGVRVNSVSPGPVDTPILADFRRSMGEDDIARSADAVGRHGRPGEVAAAIDFLLSPDASWINGVDLPVEGGLLAVRAARSTRSPT